MRVRPAQGDDIRHSERTAAWPSTTLAPRAPAVVPLRVGRLRPGAPTVDDHQEAAA